MTCNIVIRATIAVVAYLIVAGAPSAHAVSVQPLALEMAAIGSNSRATIQAVNDGAAPIPVEISIKKVEIGPDGKTTETPAGNDFLVFPPQAVIPAGGTQSFPAAVDRRAGYQEKPGIHGLCEPASGEDEAWRERRADGVQFRCAHECRAARRAVRLETCERRNGERRQEARRGGDGREPERDVRLFQRREADA